MLENKHLQLAFKQSILSMASVYLIFLFFPLGCLDFNILWVGSEIPDGLQEILVLLLQLLQVSEPHQLLWDQLGKKIHLSVISPLPWQYSQELMILRITAPRNTFSSEFPDNAMKKIGISVTCNFWSKEDMFKHRHTAAAWHTEAIHQKWRKIRYKFPFHQ